jgi:endonuclease YncB( thermonuclease family)
LKKSVRAMRGGALVKLLGTLVVVASTVALALVLGLAVLAPSARSASLSTYRVTRGIDGDTIELGNGQHVRLVQIDTPEVYFEPECFGHQASAATERLLPYGTLVRLAVEPATDRVDQYGRLLRYVIRARDGVDVNIRLVAIGAAAPYFYDGRRGRYADRLESLARRARSKHLGLWGACPRTPYDPYHGVQTRR